jgi:predicted TIM-barrel fold metal-dependent hydrolase
MAAQSRGKWSFRGCACCEETAAPARLALSRRSVLGGTAGLALSGLVPSPGSAETPTKAALVDVHHHLAPPAYIADLKKRKLGLPQTLEWTPEKSLADMDAAGVATAFLSITVPGVWFDDEDAATIALARACNEYGAKLAGDGSRRFGTFAILPLPHVDASLREIDYAFATFKADGIGLFTSYGDKYLGDAAFVPVFEELNRRKAVVYTHPTTPICCTSLIKGVSPGAIEFATDTTRTIASLLFGTGGTAFRCPDIRFIWSHSGGTLPFLIGRLVREQVVKKDPRMPDGPVPIVQKYFYEIAQGNLPGQFAALLDLVPASQLMFGSDFPFREAIEASDGFAAYKFSDADRASINAGTALKLMPRLAT